MIHFSWVILHPIGRENAFCFDISFNCLGKVDSEVLHEHLCKQSHGGEPEVKAGEFSLGYCFG